MPKTAQPPVPNLLVLAAAFVIVVAGIKAAASMVSTLLLAALVAQTLLPLTLWLVSRRLSPGLSVGVTIVILLLGGLTLVGVVGVSIAGLADRLPEYSNGVVAMKDRATAFLAARGVPVPVAGLKGLIDPQRIVAFGTGFLQALGGALGTGVVLLLFAAVLLAELTDLQLRSSAGSQSAFAEHVGRSGRSVRKFIEITGLTGAGGAVIVTGALLLLGVDYAWTWGLLYWCFNFVPAIGNLLALVPPATLALLEFGWERALAVAIIFSATNFVQDNVIKPKIMKQGLELPISVTLLSLAFWGFVLGPVGAILAVPLTLILRQVIPAYTRAAQET